MRATLRPLSFLFILSLFFCSTREILKAEVLSVPFEMRRALRNSQLLIQGIVQRKQLRFYPDREIFAYTITVRVIDHIGASINLEEGPLRLVLEFHEDEWERSGKNKLLKSGQECLVFLSTIDEREKSYLVKEKNFFWVEKEEEFDSTDKAILPFMGGKPIGMGLKEIKSEGRKVLWQYAEKNEDLSGKIGVFHNSRDARSDFEKENVFFPLPIVILTLLGVISHFLSRAGRDDKGS